MMRAWRLRAFLSVLVWGWLAGIGVTAAVAPDMRHLALSVEIFPEQRAISAVAQLHLNLGTEHRRQTVLQLSNALTVNEVRVDGAKLPFVHEKDRLHLRWPQPRRGLVEVVIRYRGNPPVAKRPPWQGGFVWAETPDRQPWISLACQIEGAGLWLPVSGDFADKIETLELRVTAPKPLFCAANGRLVAVNEEDGGRRTFVWQHNYPIIPHNISLNLADYRVEQRSFPVEPELPVIFYSLKHEPGRGGDGRRYERKRADFFGELEKYLGFMSRRYGPYPWAKEKLAVVHTPYLGMEHQTINAYGNGFRLTDGYDAILFHELAHEWFGNRVTAATPRDLWLQEGITTYITGLYLAEQQGPGAALAFYREQRQMVVASGALYPDQEPSIEAAFHNDIYTKAALLLRTLAMVVGEPKLDRILYRWVNEPTTQRPGGGTSAAFIALTHAESGLELGWFFDAYLRRAALPRLRLRSLKDGLELHWDSTDFVLPIPVRVGGEEGRAILVPMEQGRGFVPGAKLDEVTIDPEGWVLRDEEAL